MSFKGEYVVFSGELLCMSKRKAKALIYSLGGFSQHSINERTTILVKGVFRTGFTTNDKQYKKVKQAEKLAKNGYPIRIIEEKDFLIIANQELVNWIRDTYVKERAN